MLFLWLGFERNSIQYRPRGIICTFPISKINVCGYSLLQRYEGRRKIVYISHLQISVFLICLIAMKMDLLDMSSLFRTLRIRDGNAEKSLITK